MNGTDSVWVTAAIDPQTDLNVQTRLIQERAELEMAKAQLRAQIAAHRAAIRAHEAAIATLLTTLNNPDDNSG